MKYQIDNILIVDSFKRADCECALCVIEEEIEKKQLDDYNGEYVMVPDIRKLVNKKGFCKTHFKSLLKKDNKLGLSLQTYTRLKTLKDKLYVTSNVKAAKRFAENVKKELCSCVICEHIETQVMHYCEHIARRAGDFIEAIRNGKGFCLKHFAVLLETAGNAGQNTEEYLKALTETQKRDVERLCGELEYFASMYDHGSDDKPWLNCKDAPERAISKIHGKV